MTPVAEDARPPVALVHAMNPVLRRVLRTPLGRAIRPFALLEFRGRRSDRLFRVPVGWHAGPAGPVVVTPAPWRVNFRGGRDVTVWFHGHREPRRGVLDDDPDRVAAVLQHLADRHGSLNRVGVRVPEEHRITGADVVAVDRAVISFEPA
jgi:hypothetical protein